MPLQIAPRKATTQPSASPPPDASPSAVAPPTILKPKRKRPLVHLADRVYGKVLAITPRKMKEIMAFLEPRLAGSIEALPIIAYDEDDGQDEESLPYDLDGGIAIIPIQGTLVKRGSGMSAMSGMSGYEALAKCVAQAVADPNVKGILLDVDSPGGEVDGCPDLADLIYGLRGTIPTCAVCNDQTCSAAYWIASGADQVFVTRTGMIGSISCFMLHRNQAGADKAAGLDYTYVMPDEDEYKTEGNPHQPLSDHALSTMTAEVTRIRNMFVSAVARNRSVSADSILALKGGVQFAEGSIPLLADKLGTLSDALANMQARIGVSATTGALPAAPDISAEVLLEHPEEILPGNPEAVSANGRDILSAEDIEMQMQASAIPPHKTATSDKPWDGPANEARLKTDQNKAYYSRAYAWSDPKGDESKKNAYRFIHHEVSSDGTPGAANVQGCRSGIGVLNGARGGTTIPAADKPGVYRHLSAHLKAAGVEPPPLKSETEIESPTDPRYVPLVGYAPLAGTVEVDGGLCKTYDIECASGVRSPQAIELVKGLAEIRQTYPEAFGAVRQCNVGTVSGSDSRKVTLLLAPYDGSAANLGSFKEVYRPGCFRNGLNGDLRVMAFHADSSQYVLGRTSAGTARFWEDAAGLHAEAIAPETSWANDLLVSLRRNDITQSSAAFWITKQSWETRNGERYRIVEEAIAHDGSVETFPAYENTTATSATVAETETATVETDHIGLARKHLEILRLR